MILYDKEKRKRYTARNSRRPKFSHHRGRTWDSITKIVNGIEIEFHFDSTWGSNMYFSYNHKWYSIPIFQEDYSDSLQEYREVLYTKEHIESVCKAEEIVDDYFNKKRKKY